jgi:hypothetical protein
MNRRARLVRLGWILFLIGSVVFLADAVRQGDVVSAVASAMFVVGVASFMVADRLPDRCWACRRRLPRGSEEPLLLCHGCRLVVVTEHLGDVPVDGDPSSVAAR